jgi:anti-sigma B factor antagonist
MSATQPAAPPFSTRVERRDRVVYASLAGEASFEHADTLRDQLLAAADQPISGFVVDLRDLTFISSVGLGAIVAVYLRCRCRNIDFRVSGARGKVLSMFEVTKLTRLFHVDASPDAAARNRIN